MLKERHTPEERWNITQHYGTSTVVPAVLTPFQKNGSKPEEADMLLDQ